MAEQGSASDARLPGLSGDRGGLSLLSTPDVSGVDDRGPERRRPGARITLGVAGFASGSPSVCSTSKTYAARKRTTVRAFVSASASRRPMIRAMIAMPFSPLRTKHPVVRHVWKPATRVAVGHWLG